MKLTITAVDKVLFEGEAYSVNCPGSDGELTVLSHHEPLITTLGAGTIRVKESGGEAVKKFPIEHGLLEVSNNQATILV